MAVNAKEGKLIPRSGDAGVVRQLPIGLLDQASDPQVEFIDRLRHIRIHSRRAKMRTAEVTDNILAKVFNGNLQRLMTARAAAQKPYRLSHGIQTPDSRVSSTRIIAHPQSFVNMFMANKTPKGGHWLDWNKKRRGSSLSFSLFVVLAD
jgi:hypothetical protein